MTLVTMPARVITSIPSPEQGVWHLGPFPLRAYAFCILAGILTAVWLTQRRLAARGGDPDAVVDVAMWAVPFGIVGGRLYHVATSWQPYFGPGGNPANAFKIWEGGLGIWGAVALGAVGVWIGCLRSGVSFLDMGDAIAPGLALAQALGRWGNWFNNELYGGPTDLPWALEIHRWDAAQGAAVRDAGGHAVVAGTYHPTFLYESLWCLGLALLLMGIDRRVVLRRGQLFALYVVGYTLGRLWIELMRIDTANTIMGLRLNVWTSVIVMAFGAAWFLLARRERPRPRPRDVQSHPAD